MKAEIIELGQCHAEHQIYRHPETRDLRVQGKPLINWIYEVARDCTAIDEVRVTCGVAMAVFSINRKMEPAQVTVTQIL